MVRVVYVAAPLVCYLPEWRFSNAGVHGWLFPSRVVEPETRRRSPTCDSGTLLVLVDDLRTEFASILGTSTGTYC
ncbi:hypothetical protein F5I97DRAFT_1887965, partial [Phlebopus sp. FC_14]